MLSIKRLPFRMADFTRYSWVSEDARAVWEKRIDQIVNAWSEIEWLAVSEGIRKCALRLIAPDLFVEFANNMAIHGLAAIPVSIQSAGTQPYYNTVSAYQAGKPFNYHIVIGRLEDAAQFKVAYEFNNQEEMGELLGYPECCRRFFQKTWIDEQFIDTTWPMAFNTTKPKIDSSTIEVEGPNETNILLRWLGVRTVPHLPCSFHCHSTVEKAKEFISLGRRNSYTIEMDWLTEMLSWPVEWSALHGIAEIKTPIVKILSCTDATPIKYVVQRKGETYPSEGARGLVFPYEQPQRRKVTESENFSKGLSTISKKNSKHPEFYFLENGFKAEEDMFIAHQPIIELAISTLSNRPGTIMDLGCGNGALLKKIIEINKQVVPYGIEKDANKIANLQKLIPGHTANFTIGDLFNLEGYEKHDQVFSIVLLMPGRLLEASYKQVEKLKSWIKSHSSHLLVYAYGDWIKKYGSFIALTEKVGLRLLQINSNSGIAEFN